MTETPPPGAPLLIVTGGPTDGSTFALTDSADKVLGSGPQADFRIELENVEPLHGEVTWGPRGLVISDLGSANGIYVNGEKVADERVLDDGDRICLGPPGSKQSAKLLVKLPGAAKPQGGAFTLGDAQPFQFDHDREPTALAPVPEEEEAPPYVAPPPARPAPAPVSPPAAFSAPPAAAPEPPAPHPPEPEIVVIEDEEGQAPVAAPAAPPASPQSSVPPARSVAAAPSSETVRPTTAVAPSAEAVRPTTASFRRADLLTEPPSIAADRPPRERVPARMPAVAAPRPKPRARGLRVPRLVIVAGVPALVAVAGLLAYMWLNKPAPVLQQLPAKAEPGQAVTIGGAYFEVNPAGNTVRFGEQVAQVTRASEKELSVTVPALPMSSVAVTVQTRAGKSNALMVKIAPIPRITSVVPDVALANQEVTLKGVNLGGASPSATVGGVPADVVASQADELRIRIPVSNVDEGMTVPIVVKVGEETSKATNLMIGRLPLLASVTPRQGQAGDHVVLKGRGFDPNPDANLVTFGSQAALVLTASPSELVVLAPMAGMSVQEAVPVTVQTGDRSSRSLDFVITRVSLGTYVPRFYAAAAGEHPGHGHAFVSTELGPLLILSDKATANSTAERADQVARALNDLVKSAQAQTALFEFRENPPSVAVAGSALPPIVVTAKDAAAYGESWDAATRPAQVTPRSVARYWAALLQDVFSLFVTRERPVKVVELSPRGRVLLDIYAEAARRSGPGSGVPTGVLSPLSSTMAKGLRDMALLLPGASAAARASTAIEGSWEGTMREADQTRPIQMSIASDGARLTGSITVHKGELSLRSSLSDVAFENGTLHFSTSLGGSLRHFNGTAQGDTLSGTIHAQPGGPSVGEFRLRFVN